jgi:DNA-cytosine methyltransferase
MIRILDLCSGIGGFSLGLEATGGFETVAFCEVDEFCCKVLNKHWPGVPIYKDLKELGNDPTRIVQEFDLICGGIPCQPFSVAGKKKGKEDDRHLWPYMHEIIKHKKPSWVIVENVGGFVNVALDDVCLDLEAQGYATQSFIIPACSVEAPHRRDRIWILGKNIEERLKKHLEDTRRSLRKGRVEQGENADEVGQGHADQSERSSSTSRSDVAYASIEGLEGRISGDNQGGQERKALSRGEEQQDEVGTDTRCGSGTSTEKDVSDSGRKGLQGHRGEHGLREASEEEQTSGRSEERDVPHTEKLDRHVDVNGLSGEDNGQQRQGLQGELGGTSGNRTEDVANTERLGQQGQGEHERPSDTTKDRKGQASGTDNGSQGQTGQGHTEPGVGGMADGLSARLDGHFGFEVEPDIPRVATGIPERVNRLKALGNSIVPQIVRNIGLAILKNEEDDRRVR